MSFVGCESEFKSRDKEILGQIEQDFERRGFDSHSSPSGELIIQLHFFLLFDKFIKRLPDEFIEKNKNIFCFSLLNIVFLFAPLL